MKYGPIKSLAIAVSLIAAPALAQKMPDIGFESVGRGRPLAASVLDKEQEVGSASSALKPAMTRRIRFR